MKKIIFIEYIDALYYTDRLGFKDFPRHFCIGNLVEKTKKHILISFIEKGKGLIEEGLLIPTEALINQKNKKIKKFNLKVKEKIGIFWKDIVYFKNNKIPKESTLAYSEGDVFSTTRDAVILKSAKTILIKEKIINHPKKSVKFVVIPKVFITSIEKYE